MRDDLHFAVNLESPIAVYVQLENQVQFAIASGRLKAGDTLPSVREMSTCVNVNPNTVTKAYRDLELLGLVHTRRGVGVTVSEKALKLCGGKIRSIVQGHLADSVAECLACGLSAVDVRKIVSSAVDSGRAPYTEK